MKLKRKKYRLGLLILIGLAIIAIIQYVTVFSLPQHSNDKPKRDIIENDRLLEEKNRKEYLEKETKNLEELKNRVEEERNRIGQIKSEASKQNGSKNNGENAKRLEEERKRVQREMDRLKLLELKEAENAKRIQNLKLEQKSKIETLLKQSLIVSSDEEMHLKKTYEVSCIITDFNNKENVNKSIQHERRSKIIDDSISTSKIMSMKLIGVNFDIHELNESKQALNFIDKQTEWKWKVQPLESGKQILEIEGYAYIEVDGEQTPIKINVYKKEIDVNIGFVNAIQLTVRKNWEWIFGIIPFFWFLFNRYKKKENENAAHNT